MSLRPASGSEPGFLFLSTRVEKEQRKEGREGGWEGEKKVDQVLWYPMHFMTSFSFYNWGNVGCKRLTDFLTFHRS